MHDSIYLLCFLFCFLLKSGKIIIFNVGCIFLCLGQTLRNLSAPQSACHYLVVKVSLSLSCSVFFPFSSSLPRSVINSLSDFSELDFVTAAAAAALLVAAIKTASVSNLSANCSSCCWLVGCQSIPWLPWLWPVLGRASRTRDGFDSR